MKKNTGKTIILVFAALIFIAGIFYSQRSSKSVPAGNIQPALSGQISQLDGSVSGRVKHVFIVMEENTPYKDVIGNTSDMPYLNNLATTYAYAKNYFADTHPSIGNYFMLTTGNIITNNSNTSKIVSDDNIVRELTVAGKTWKEYSESLPVVGYLGNTQQPYEKDHNPISYFSDVTQNPDQAKNMVPFSQFAADLADHQLPDFVFIVPNSYDQADSCPPSGKCNKLAAADQWLATNIGPLIKSPDFSVPGGGLLIIVFDEAAKSDKQNGGGQVAWIAVGPDVKKGYTSENFYQHENTLHFMSELIGLTTFPGKAATAANMGEFLIGN